MPDLRFLVKSQIVAENSELLNENTGQLKQTRVLTPPSLFSLRLRMYTDLAPNTDYSLKHPKFPSETADLPLHSVYHFKEVKPYLPAGNLSIST